ncbi:MAG: glucose 1-dehydrogenase [Solirubrobacterales bacterium]|nr:glucose 1-dehydrogenase [Solirubrobacterales bacterium]
MTGMLEGKVAIVTGGARGLGRAVAERYAAEGATVVVADLETHAAEDTAGEIDGAEGVACDMRSEDAVAALVAGAVERHGRLDVMVANAGISTVGPVAETSLEDWRELMSVNLDGVFLCVKHAGPAIAASGGGAIVNMASITAMAGVPLLAAYAASKAAVVSLTKTAALELRDQGVRVNALCPGFIGTDMVARHRAALEAGLGIDLEEALEHAQGGFGSEADVAGVAAFLASERSSFSTGSAFVVDGGATASLV